MAGPDTIPELSYQKPDGSLFSRLEMEEQTRQVWPKIHWVRLMANKIYGLPRQAAFDMKEAFIRHWVLDEMVRRGQITGDVSGVDAQTYNDDATSRQFIQRLQFLIQAGQAIVPKEGEGVDMSGFTPPPPPMGMMPPPNGQPQQMPFQPPAPQGFAPPMPQGMPPQGPPQMQPPMAPPQMQPPQGPPQQQYAPPMPGAGMPQMPQTPVPPMPGALPPQMPQQAAPQAGGRRKRGGDQQAAPGQQQAAPVPPMPSGPPGGGFQPPPQFAPPGAPPMMQQPPGAPPPQFAAPPAGPPQFAAPPQPQQQAPQPVPVAPDPALLQKLDQVLANQARLSADLAVVQAGICVALRATYQQPGDANLRTFLTGLGIQVPQ